MAVAILQAIDGAHMLRDLAAGVAIGEYTEEMVPAFRAATAE